MPADRDPIDLAASALRHRDRSRHELDERLARAGVEEGERADALETLERVGYVDDARFAAARADALSGRGFGDEAIRHDLATHGIADEAADEAIAALVPELERALVLVGRLGRSVKSARHLVRKGFGEDIVAAAVGPDVAQGEG